MSVTSPAAPITNASNSISLPPGWRIIHVGKAAMYINSSLKLACIAAPKKKIKRSTKVSLESGTYVVTPKPLGLTSSWEQAVALEPDGQTGVFLYHNTDEGTTTREDPRPSLVLGNDPLPTGWTFAYDDDGDMIFLNHLEGTTTYDDPRFVCPNGKQDVAERMAEVHLRGTNADAGLDHGAADDCAAWKIMKPRIADFNDLPQHLTTKAKLPADVVGKGLNRYINILPNPRTRVIIEDDYEKTEISQYINANYIAGYDSRPREYVAAMGPLDNTIEAFWRMVWMLKSPAIVMTTPMMEQGKVKCARYWPTVKYNEQKQCGDKLYGEISVAVIDGQRRPGYILTNLRLRKGREEWCMRHYWFNAWPDHSTPGAEGATQVVDMMKSVRAFCNKAKAGPPIVHCSAGIGRTGTFIAIDQAIRKLEETGQVDCLDIVDMLRQHRGGMVQHPQQYEFVIKACASYAHSHGQPYKMVAFDDKDTVPIPPPRSGNVNWKHTLKSRKPEVLAEMIAKGRPANMPDAEWEKLNRKYRKQQASIRAASSIRRVMDEAEMHGELRLGTLSGGTADGKFRPSVQQVFEE